MSAESTLKNLAKHLGYTQRQLDVHPDSPMERKLKQAEALGCTHCWYGIYLEYSTNISYILMLARKSKYSDFTDIHDDVPDCNFIRKSGFDVYICKYTPRAENEWSPT